jgi:hypothetical protein
MISLHADPSRKLIRVSMSGFLGAAEVATFLVELRDAFAAMRVPVEQVGVLVETPGQVLQQQEVVTTFAQLATQLNPGPRIAVVCAGRLLHMQLRRILPPARAATFESVAEAERWLEDRGRNSRAA